jgi:ketosteroid isomerase-like protein
MDQDELHSRSVQAYFDGINSEHYEEVAALFAPDGELIAPGTDARRGREAIAAYFAAALRPYLEHLDDPTRTIFAGDTVTVEIHYTGRLASGFPLEFDAVDVIDFDADGLIRRLSSWYDSHAVRTALRVARERAEKSDALTLGEETLA